MVQSKDMSGRLDKKETANKKLILGQRVHIDWKQGDGKRYFMQTEMTRKQGLRYLNKIDFKTKILKIKKDTIEWWKDQYKRILHLSTHMYPI